MKRNALDLWPPSILWDAPLSLARMPPLLEGRTWRGSPLFRKQGAHPVSSPSRRLITLADRFTSERTDPAEAPGGAAAFSCSPEVPGCGLGPGCCAAARCHARAVPAPRPSAVSPATSVVLSHVSQQNLHRTRRRNVCVKPNAALPSTLHQIRWKSFCIKHVSVWLRHDYSGVPSILQIDRNIFW